MMNLIEYQQLDDPWNSDHLPSAYHIGVNVVRYEKRTDRISNKKTMWEVYAKELQRGRNRDGGI